LITKQSFALFLFAGTQAGSAIPDFGRLGICSTIGAIPEKAARNSDCSRSPLISCEFVILSEPQITYAVENRRIVSKVFVLRKGIAGPYGVSASDSITVARSKISKMTGLKFPIFDQEIRYLQSSDIHCIGNSYTISIFFDETKKASKIVSSTLPPI
jgi:hypothetical protein